MRRAITQSDNDAAMALWAQLGTPTNAAVQTQAVLRATGDSDTSVPAQTVRPGFTPFGQANWSLAAQAAFAAKLPCLANAAPVLQLMREVTPSQRWGVGTLPIPVAFKGGWGPGTNGAYLVRQMAVVTMSNGAQLGMALAFAPSDGRFESAVTGLTALAHWAAENVTAEAGSTPSC